MEREREREREFVKLGLTYYQADRKSNGSLAPNKSS